MTSSFNAPAPAPGMPAVPPRLPDLGPPPPPDATLPRTYPQLLRGPRYRWWRSLLSILAAVGGFVLVQVVAGVVLMGVLLASGSSLLDMADSTAFTRSVMDNPWAFLINNLGLAALIAVAGLSVWACHGWRPRWVSSVAAGIRWRLLLVSAVICAVVYAVYTAVTMVATGQGWPSGGSNVALLLVMVVLTTPLQAAGEEYLFRGVLTQSIGSWFRAPVVAALVSGLLTALAFAAVHSIGGPQNGWLFFTRFAMGAVLSFLAWRTGGLEAAIALHTVNNVFGLVPAILDGGLGEALSNPPQGSVSSLTQLVSVLIATVLVVVVAHRSRVSMRHLPAEQPGGVPNRTDRWPVEAPFAPGPH